MIEGASDFVKWASILGYKPGGGSGGGVTPQQVQNSSFKCWIRHWRGRCLCC